MRWSLPCRDAAYRSVRSIRGPTQHSVSTQRPRSLDRTDKTDVVRGTFPQQRQNRHRSSAEQAALPLLSPVIARGSVASWSMAPRRGCCSLRDSEPTRLRGKVQLQDIRLQQCRGHRQQLDGMHGAAAYLYQGGFPFGLIWPKSSGLERDMLLSLLRHCVHVGSEIVIKRARPFGFHVSLQSKSAAPAKRLPETQVVRG